MVWHHISYYMNYLPYKIFYYTAFLVIGWVFVYLPLWIYYFRYLNLLFSLFGTLSSTHAPLIWSHLSNWHKYFILQCNLHEFSSLSFQFRYPLLHVSMTRLLVLSSHSSHFRHKFKVLLLYHSSKLHRDKVKFCPICHNFSDLQQNTPHGFCCCCSVTKSCPTLCDAMDCSSPGFPALHHLTEFAQTHVHWVCDVIQSSYPLSSPSSPDFNLSQHQSLFQWASSHWVYEWINKQTDEEMPTEDMKYNLYFTFLGGFSEKY